jgi:HD superfamily phosphodiesterase
VKDLLEAPEVRRLTSCHAHSLDRNEGNRRDHGLRVGYFSFRFAKQMRISNPRKFARAGTLHDVGASLLGYSNGYRHEKISADIAKKYGEDEETQEAIRTHMFLFYHYEPPRSLLGLTVWFFDKVDCLVELFGLSSFFDRLLIENLYKSNE